VVEEQPSLVSVGVVLNLGPGTRDLTIARRLADGSRAIPVAGLVIRNLVDNAVRYASSTVTMACRPQAGQVVITIADDGPGIPVQDRARVFERFVRLDPTRTRSSGGSGLGLSIVEQIVRSHHGSVAVSDAAHGGAVFTLTLPRGQQDLAGTGYGTGSLRSR
jgi:signal transduction histidine kinase